MVPEKALGVSEDRVYIDRVYIDRGDADPPRRLNRSFLRRNRPETAQCPSERGEAGDNRIAVSVPGVEAGMDGLLYALLVGIDRYPGRPLSGCRNDVQDAAGLLKERAGGRLRLRVLLDEEATRAEVIAAFRKHFARCGPEDVALFWFAGHGSEQPVAEELWWLEPSGTAQSLVCVDSRQGGVPDLLDKELGVLAGEVGRRGAHCVAVLDCCHAESGTRDPDSAVRALPASNEPAGARALLPDLGGAVADEMEETHVLLAACRTFEKAMEVRMEGRRRGAFSYALVRVLREATPGTTVRDVHIRTRRMVENLCRDQVPVLYPASPGGLADAPVFGGAVTPPAVPFTLRRVRGGWEVDAGFCHGVTAGATLTVRSGVERGARVRVSAASAGRADVAPDGWQPDPERTYPVAVESLPVVPATVRVTGSGAATLEEAIDGLGSPFLAVDDDAPTWTVTIDSSAADVRMADGSLILSTGGEALRDLPLRLEQLAVWTHVRDLRNPWSRLDGLVDLEVVAAEPGESRAPRDSPALRPDPSGEIHLSYRHDGQSWMPPEVFIRIRNRSSRRLWCVLLDLTDRYRMHPSLFPGAFVGPGMVAAAAHGRPIPVSLPPGRPQRPGSSALDWCELIVSEEEVSSVPFSLPSIDAPPLRSAATALRTWRGRREMAAPDVSAGDWTTVLLPVRTVIPDLPARQ
ncbi:caspase family protein [Actinomadura nitritigenes]|uniref:caspase family protein n=1 Tax=Actinomadura nitritigenes TaxID=134602 RepID=UPI003D8A2080